MMRSTTYLCRWPDGEFSIVQAKDRSGAVFKLDERGGAEAGSLIPLQDFMAHFRLNDQGAIEFAGFGEETEDLIWSTCYPHVNDMLCTELAMRHLDGQPCPEAVQLIKEAVERERHH
jgi:hypothetical protein